MRARLWPFLLGFALPAFSLSLSEAPRAYLIPGFSPQFGAAQFVVADLDLDGKSDVVIDGPTGAILYGRGDGSFDAGPEFIAGGWQDPLTMHVVVADLDGDHFPDIVANDYHADALYGVVLRRSLRGRAFADPVSIYASARPIAAADFTGDGAADILLATTPPASGVLLINNGHGVFTDRLLPDIDFRREAAAIGDFDGDGDLDITVSYRVYLNDGHGSFAPRQNNHEYKAPVVADFDEDGRADVIGLREQERMLTIMPGATLLNGSDIAVGNNPRTATAGDFNNDGHADLAVIRDDYRTIVDEQGSQSSTNEAGVDIYLGDGRRGLNIRFRFRVDSYYSYNPYPIATADLNRDGALDLLVPSNKDGIAVVLGNGDGTFRTPPQIPGTRPSSVLGAGDLDGDGIDELLLGSTPLVVGWLNGAGNYSFEPFPLSVERPDTRPIAIGATSETRASLVIAIDNIVHVLSATAPGQWSDRTFDAGDTVRAVQVWREGSGARVAVITGNVSMPLLKIFSISGAELHRATLAPVHPQYGSQTWQIDVADADRDGALDLIVSALSSHGYVFHTGVLGADGYISTLRGRGDGTFGAQEMYASDRTLRALTIGDVNRDGAIDVVADTRWYTPPIPVTFVNDGHGRFNEREGLVTDFPFVIKDLDFDGLPDLHSGASIAFGSGKSVRYFRSIPTVLARRRRNAPPSLIGTDYPTYELIVVDLDPPKRSRAARH